MRYFYNYYMDYEKLQRLEDEIKNLKVMINELKNEIIKIKEDLKDLKISLPYWLFG